MLRDLAWIILWIASSTFSTAMNTNTTAPIVDLGYAQYQGYTDPQTNVSNFLSIRYAAAPLGNLRFQAPQPPLRETSIQSATQNPNICPQAGFGLTPTTSPPASEDCLFLNVFVPGMIPEQPTTMGGLPVLVWIHGGGYQWGYAAQYNGSDLMAHSLDTLIVVVIQYRLGAFGMPSDLEASCFLSGNEVKAQGALNAGLLDQTLALEWVQDHIGSFGGDKHHVTIWGESAGAGSVLQHIVANGGNTLPPLFNAAMASSTYLPSQYYYSDSAPQVVDMTGCASSADTFKCLQSVETETLQGVNYNISGSAFYGTFVFIPVVDGTFILERPTITLAKGQVNGQIILVVHNQHEGNFFVDVNETLTVTGYISKLFPEMTSIQLQEAASIYKDYGTMVDQATLAIGDSMIVCPSHYLLNAFAGRSWKGLFAIPPAYHGQDSIYYFSGPTNIPPYDSPTFIAAFSESFMSLAKYYNVNIKFDPDNITPYWDMHGVRETEMLFNRTEAGAPDVVPIETDPRILQRCAFWSRVTAMTAQ